MTTILHSTFTITISATSPVHQLSSNDVNFLIHSTATLFIYFLFGHKSLRIIFWKKPISDKDTFKLFLFLIGNGCSPHLTSHWILTSQHWTTDKKAEKRARQLDFLLNNMDKKSHIWFYFDLHCEEWLYLNGQKRSTNN